MSKGYRVKVNGQYVDEQAVGWEGYEIISMSVMNGPPPNSDVEHFMYLLVEMGKMAREAKTLLPSIKAYLHPHDYVNLEEAFYTLSECPP